MSGPSRREMMLALAMVPVAGMTIAIPAKRSPRCAIGIVPFGDGEHLTTCQRNPDGTLTHRKETPGQLAARLRAREAGHVA
jgi:hypothetical protein